MGVHGTVDVISRAMEDIAPTAMAMEGDRVGLIAGDSRAEVGRVMVAVDPTPAALDEARDAGCQVLVSHHPPLRPFAPPPAVLLSDRPPGDVLARAFRYGVALYSAHTNYDAAPAGMNDLMAARLGLNDLKPLAVFRHEPVYKLIVFVPAEYDDKVRDAVAAAGAGCIGNYSHCTFQSAGVGTFLPREGTRPFVGRVGELERVDERRLETVVPASVKDRVVAAMLAAHPYEEVAWDLVRLENAARPLGMARLGRVAGPLTLGELADRAREMFGVASVHVAGDDGRDASEVATCAGALAPGVMDEAAAGGARAVVVGEAGLNGARRAEALGMGLVEVGHYPSEAAFVADVARRLADGLREKGLDIEVLQCRSSGDPFHFRGGGRPGRRGRGGR